MDIPREMIIQTLRGRGDFDAAERAERELPEKVDTDIDAGLLTEFAIEPDEIEEGLSGQQPNAG
jgi:hypothetical protein